MQKLVAAVDDALRVEGPEAVHPAPRGGQRLPQQRVRARREGPVPFYGEGPPRAGPPGASSGLGWLDGAWPGSWLELGLPYYSTVAYPTCDLSMSVCRPVQCTGTYSTDVHAYCVAYCIYL